MTDVRATRPVYAQPRISERFAIADEAAGRTLATLIGERLPVDPLYPVPQVVRSTYLEPPGGYADDAREFVRVREYLGAASAPAPSGRGSAFVEIKTVLDSGLKQKQRIGVAADVLEQVGKGPVAAAQAIGVARRARRSAPATSPGACSRSGRPPARRCRGGWTTRCARALRAAR